MGLYDRINFFDDATSIDDDNIARQLAALPAPTPQAAPQPEEHSSLFRRIAGDTAVTALKGAIGLPESIVGIADIPTGGRVGKGLEYVGFRPREAKKTLDELYSPEQKAAFANVQQAKGFLPTVQAIVENPSVAAHTALESAPSLLGGAGIARGAIKVLPKLAPFVAGAIGEGAITAGQNAEAIRAETPDHLLTPEQASLAGLSGIVTGGIGAAAGKFANKAGIANIETMLASGSGKAINKGLARQMAEGALTEGMLEELPQSMQEQALQNIALGKPWHEGVVESGAQGMITGGLMGAGGGGFNAIGHPATSDTANPQQAAVQAPPPNGPLSKALATIQATPEPQQQGDDFLLPFDGIQIDPAELEQQFAVAQSASPLSADQQQVYDRLQTLAEDETGIVPDRPAAGPATAELLGGPSEFRTP
ncbi:hypothetical protein, partial [Trichlorobacter lovleyi]|uniref:hypothetical protein n=1 Tax=Trichlorobacter lovleyi TaxID=313985 RepID=UPI003D09B1E3